MRREFAYLADILAACDKISEYVESQTPGSFETGSIVRDAVYHQLMIIGEATRYRSDATKAQMPQIPWAAVRRMRNILVNDYLVVMSTKPLSGKRSREIFQFLQTRFAR